MTPKQFAKLPSVSLKPFSQRTAVLLKSVDEWNAACELYEADSAILEDDGEYRGMSYAVPGYTNPYFIGVFDGKAQTLVHECCHLTIAITKRIEYNPTVEDEPFCYFLDHVFGSLNEYL